MNAQYLTLLAAVAPVFAVIAAGFLMRRARWLTAEADQSLLRITVNFLYPALILDKVLGNPALRSLSTVLLAPAVGFGTTALGFGLALLAARALRLGDSNSQRTFAFSTGLYNYGYIPLPIILTLFDERTVGVLFLHNLGVEIALWTLGVVILTGATGGGWRRMINGPTVAIVIALTLNFAHARDWLPSFTLAAAKLAGDAAIPLGLILSGAILADLLRGTRFGGGTRVIAAGSLLRLAVLPALFLLLAFFIPASIELKRVIAIQAAMPAAMIPIVLARLYGGDTATALRVVVATTLISLVTIPLWIRLGTALLGL